MTLPAPELSGPAAIAFSGGGDSTAMIYAFRDHPQITHALIIDHALRDGSAEEAAEAAVFARSLGYEVQIDRWQNDGPKTGIQVKARAYRYKALGEMCRAAGLENLITAHTADDQAETLLMRLDRQTGWRGLAGMPDRAYGALWPALADVTLHRPWLGVSRAEIRDYNRVQGLYFVDDPSNENSDFTRIKVRQVLSADNDLRQDLLQTQKHERRRLSKERAGHAAWLSQHAVISDQNYVETDAVPEPEVLLHILRSVAGTGGPIDRVRRVNLVKRLTHRDFQAATLAGAWVVKRPNGFLFTRDKVAVSGRDTHSALGERYVLQHETAIWDGRFIIQVKSKGVWIEPAFGNGCNIRQSIEKDKFLGCPEQVRPSLPLFTMGSETLGLGACSTDKLVSRATAARRLHSLFPQQTA